MFEKDYSKVIIKEFSKKIKPMNNIIFTSHHPSKRCGSHAG
jgi:hypothetical protein